jgi:hypothetical protein
MKPHHEIFKLFTKQVERLGFSKLKTSWWERRGDVLLQKIHIHKFTFTTNFRVHAAVHLVGFEKDLCWLNGMHSHDGWFEKQVMGLPIGRYNFDYGESPASWQPAADNLFMFTKDVLVPWFEKWSDIERLTSDANSPLNGDQKASLAHA